MPDFEPLRVEVLLDRQVFPGQEFAHDLDAALADGHIAQLDRPVRDIGYLLHAREQRAPALQDVPLARGGANLLTGTPHDA